MNSTLEILEFTQVFKVTDARWIGFSSLPFSGVFVEPNVSENRIMSTLLEERGIRPRDPMAISGNEIWNSDSRLRGKEREYTISLPRD